MKVNKMQCRTCLYKSKDKIFGCNYIILTGCRRPCEPSPNCTAYKKYSRREREQLDKKIIYDGLAQNVPTPRKRKRKKRVEKND